MRQYGIIRDQAYEADHRISNNLSMISAFLRRKTRSLQINDNLITENCALTALEEAAFQIEVVACLHKMLSLSPDGRKINLDDYLRSVCNAAVSSLSSAGRLSPQYTLSCGRIVAPEFAVSIALAVAELLINSIKYAHPAGVDGTVVVTAKWRGHDLAIDVADDGVGLPDHYDPMTDGGLGLKLVRATAMRWGGTVEFDTSELGLCVRLVLPAEACADRLPQHDTAGNERFPPEA